ncbi:hypothetical protein KO495_00935 [Colwellia sp. D2M02]|nr:hypothetical protein [Colwellia sp. D2M02]MBU2891882.1 hypothetical protein [Colwellia sp. D2M02]
MKKPSSRGCKLSSVILAVLIMTVSAILSNASVADNMDVEITQSSK